MRADHDRPAAPFIVGVSRSGTTLLRLMIDAHPDYAIPPECQFVAAVLGTEPAGGGWEDAMGARMTAAASWPDYGLDAAAFRDAVRAAAPSSVGDVLRVFYHAYAARHGKPRWGDKTPGNVKRMDLLSRTLPEARFVHLIRDGLDVAASLRDLWFGPSESYAQCVAHWAAQIAGARAQRSAGIRYLEVRYERLVTEPAATLRTICDFLGFGFDAAMLAYPARAEARLDELQDIPARGESREMRIAIHANARNAPAPDRIGRWRAVMSPADVAACRAAGGAILREFLAE